MSVIMTLRASGDPSAVERYAQENQETMQAILESAKENGVIAHRFYGSDDGQVMVVDEWPDPQSFQSFFEAESAAIGPIMQETGVQGEPEITFWRKLETGDDIGWEEA